MVVADQFPLFKLATLIARQLSAPIATRIKQYAKTHPRFSQSVCMRTGRGYRTVDLHFKMWMLNLGRPVRAPPLSDREALEVGADILGEMVIFALGACIITYEFNRQAAKQELKLLEQRSQWVALLVALEELQRELLLQQGEIDQFHDTLVRLQFASAHTSPTSPSAATPVTPAPSTSESVDSDANEFSSQVTPSSLTTTKPRSSPSSPPRCS